MRREENSWEEKGESCAPMANESYYSRQNKRYQHESHRVSQLTFICSDSADEVFWAYDEVFSVEKA